MHGHHQVESSQVNVYDSAVHECVLNITASSIQIYTVQYDMLTSALICQKDF